MNDPLNKPLVVRCRDCKLASFRRATNGRLLHKPGRCVAELPTIRALCLQDGIAGPAAKVSIWPDHEGHCDFYIAANTTTQKD